MDELMMMKQTYKRIGFSLLGMAAATFLAQLILGMILAVFSLQDGGTFEDTWMMWLTSFLPLYAIGVPVGVLMMKKLPAEDCEQKKLGGKNFCIFLLMCFPIMYGGNIIGNLLSMLLSGGAAENALMDYAFDTGFLKILIMVVVAPLIEEFVFRKQIIDRCVHHGKKKAILFSAAAFGLFHMNLFQLFYAFGIGLVFAYVYVRTRRLVYPVIMHMIINFMGSVIAPLLLEIVDLDAIAQLETGAVDQAAMMELLPGLMVVGLYGLVIMTLSITGLILLIVKGKESAFLATKEERQWNTVYGNAGVLCYVIFCLICCVISLFGV